MSGEAKLHWTERDRMESRRRAEAWTARQAARLGTNSGVIIEAIRGKPSWLPDQIERVQSVQELAGPLPALNGVEPWVDGRLRRVNPRPRVRDAAMAEAMKRARAA